MPRTLPWLTSDNGNGGTRDAKRAIKLQPDSDSDLDRTPKATKRAAKKDIFRSCEYRSLPSGYAITCLLTRFLSQSSRTVHPTMSIRRVSSNDQNPLTTILSNSDKQIPNRRLRQRRHLHDGRRRILRRRAILHQTPPLRRIHPTSQRSQIAELI